MSINFLFSLIIFILANFFINNPSESFAESTGLAKAIKAAQDNNYTEAVSILKLEIGKDSSNYQVYLKLADVYHLGKIERTGIAFFERAVKKNPGEPNNYAGLAVLYDYQKDEAQSFLNSRKALKKGHNSYRILELFVDTGVALKKNGQLSGTLRAFKKSETRKHLYDLGYTLWRIKVKNYKRARKTVTEFLEKNNDHPYGLKLAGDIAGAEKKTRKAINNYLRAEKQLPDTEERIRGELYADLGSAYLKRGQADSAGFYYKKSVDFTKATYQMPQFIESVKNTAAFYRGESDIRNLVTILSENRELFSQNVDDATRLNFVYDLAEAYNNSGDVLKALKVFSQALEMAITLENNGKQAKIFYMMGKYHLKLGLAKKALDYFTKSIDAAGKARLPELEYKAVFEVGKVYAQSGDRAASKKSFLKVLRYAQRRQQLDLIEESYFRLMHLYLQQPTDLRSVHYYLNMAAAMARQTSQLHFAANHHWVQGLVALLEEDVETAETYFLHAIQIGAESGSYLSRLAGKAGLIKVYLHTNFSDLACSYADSALIFLENYYSYCFSEYSSDFFDLKNDLIMPALMAYSSIGDLEKIYYTIELYKSIIHYDELNQIKYKLSDKTAISIQKKFDAKSAQINSKWRELWVISRDKSEYLDTAFRIKNTIHGLHAEQLKYLDDIEKKHPKYFPFFKPTPRPLTELQKDLMRENSTFIHYFIGDLATFIVVVKGNSINCQRVNINRTFLENHISQVSPLFSTEKSNFSILENSDVSKFSLAQAGMVYKFLFQPIEPWLNSNETLIISKDAVLNRVPFEALVVNSDQLLDDLDFSNAVFLVEKYAISYLPSAYFLKTAKKKKRDSEKILGLFAATQNQDDGVGENGRPQESQVKKVNRMQSFQKFIEPFGEGESTLFLNNFANRENFVKQSSQFQFLQVSLPASLNEQFPFLSNFTFADHSQDTFSAYELFNQPVNSDIFVLTDADVKLAKTGYQIAANGFFHGLTFAGVPSFVTSLWRQQPSDVNSVADILFQFENNLKRGLNKAKALQQAKIEYLKGNRVNPFFWASLVLYGDTGAVEIMEAQTRWVIWFSILAILTLCLFLGMQLLKVFRER